MKKSIFLVLTVLVMLSCRNRDLQREEALKETGKLIMEEPELFPVVQTIRDLDRTLQDINHSLRGEDGEFKDRIDSLNSTLEDTQEGLKNLESVLEAQRQNLHDLRLSYEAEAATP